MRTDTNPPKLAFSIKEASAATSLARSTLYNHIAAKRLKAHRIAGRTIILRESLEAFLRNEVA